MDMRSADMVSGQDQGRKNSRRSGVGLGPMLIVDTTASAGARRAALDALVPAVHVRLFALAVDVGYRVVFVGVPDNIFCLRSRKYSGFLIERVADRHSCKIETWVHDHDKSWSAAAAVRITVGGTA